MKLMRRHLLWLETLGSFAQVKEGPRLLAAQVKGRKRPKWARNLCS